MDEAGQMDPWPPGSKEQAAQNILDIMCTNMHSTHMLPFTVEFRTGLSLHQQLVYAVQKAIISGQLLPGTAFPSVRKLSQELRINPNTAQKVVTRLVDQGLLEVKPGVGTMVARLPEASPRERSALLEHEAEALVVEARRLSLTLEQILEAVQDHWNGLSDVSNTARENPGKEGTK